MWVISLFLLVSLARGLPILFILSKKQLLVFVDFFYSFLISIFVYFLSDLYFFFWLVCVCVCVRTCTQACLILCDLMDCSPPGFSMEFSGLECWSGLSFPILGVFLTQKSNLSLLHLLQWQLDSLPLHHLGSPLLTLHFVFIFIFYSLFKWWVKLFIWDFSFAFWKRPMNFPFRTAFAASRRFCIVMFSLSFV